MFRDIATIRKILFPVLLWFFLYNFRTLSSPLHVTLVANEDGYIILLRFGVRWIARDLACINTPDVSLVTSLEHVYFWIDIDDSSDFISSLVSLLVQFSVIRTLDYTENQGCHDANLVVIADTGGCRYGNPWCHQWQQSWCHDDDITWILSIV